MLYVNHRLLFPSLVYQRDFVMKGPPVSEGDSDKGTVVKNNKPSWTKKVKLYKLDWEKIELEKERKHKKWNKTQWPDFKVPYTNTLPEELDEEIKNIIFALSPGYLNEIRRCSQQGLAEWNVSRPFDTVIREMCLEIPKKYIKVAFSLMSDCVFDEGTGYWKHGNRRETACLMLYKFWCNQTGRGLLTDRGFSGWDEEYKWVKKWSKKEEEKNRVERINKLLLEHKKQLDDAMDEIYVELEEKNK